MKFRLIIAAFIAVVAAACGDDTQFRVTGEVQGLGTRTINMFYVADGAVHQEGQPAIDGKFDLHGVSGEYTIVELFTAQRALIARMIVKNGQTINCKLDLDNPYVIELKGNKPVEQWSEWIRQNAGVIEIGDSRQVNNLVADYVINHRDDILSSALMLTTYYAPDNESQADSLFALIAPTARPDKLVDDYRLLLSYNNSAHLNAKMRPFSLYSYGDSTEHYAPGKASYTLFYFANQEHRRDTIVRAIDAIYDNYSRRRLKVLDVSCATDTLSWKRERPDSLKWTRVWTPGGSGKRDIRPSKHTATTVLHTRRLFWQASVSWRVGHCRHRQPSATPPLTLPSNLGNIGIYRLEFFDKFIFIFGGNNHR